MTAEAKPKKRTVFFSTVTGEKLLSRTEQKWDLVGEEVLGNLFKMKIVWSKYEPFKLKIGNTWYRVDWAYQLEDGRMVLVEVKEAWSQIGIRDSMTRVTVASGLFSMFEWIAVAPIAIKRGGGWQLKHMVEGAWKSIILQNNQTGGIQRS